MMVHGLQMEPVLSLQASAISKMGNNLDVESLSALWTVFSKCAESIEHGRRLENLSWRLWFRAGDHNGTEVDSQTQDWSDPEAFETTSEEDSDQEQLSETLPPRVTRPPLFHRATGSSSERRALCAKTISGTSLERMISGLKTELVAPTPRSAITVDRVGRLADSPLKQQVLVGTDVKCNNPAPIPPSSLSRQATPTFPKLLSHPLASMHSPLLNRPLSQPRSASSRSLSAQSTNARASSSRLAPLSRPAPSSDRLLSQIGADIPRNFSTTSFEPKSFTRGFDASHQAILPPVGLIAPPPTPAPARVKLGSPPPSAMKSAKKSTTTRKIFFISSPNSDSEEESRSRSRERDGRPCSSRSTGVNPPSNSLTSITATPPAQRRRSPPVAATPTTATDEDWDDEDEEDDDDASSGWGSEYSTDSDAPARRSTKPERPTALFAKRASTANVLEAALKPRPAGLLSQLFHPPYGHEELSSTQSYVDVSRVAVSPGGVLHGSKSTGMLAEPRRTKSFLRGAPVGTEMDSDSDGENIAAGDDEEFEDVESSRSSSHQGNERSGGLRERAHQSMIDIAGAYPQTPRTTRRAMLATELSESLRRNLLWERQTRNKVPIHPSGDIPASSHQVGQSTKPRSHGGAHSTSGEKELSAPHPSPATSSPFQPIVRRHTTGTGLYLAAQTGKLGNESSSSLSISEGEEGEGEGRDAFGSAFAHGVHSRGW